MTDYPEIRLDDKIYTFQRDLKVYAVAALNEILHDARKGLFEAAFKADAAGAQVDMAAAAMQYMEIEHDILRSGNYPRFIAACVAQSEADLKRLTKEFVALDYKKTRHILDFFFNGEAIFTVLFPSFSLDPADTEKTTPSTDSSTS